MFNELLKKECIAVDFQKLKEIKEKNQALETPGNIANLASRYYNISNLIKQHENELKIIKEQIISELNNRGETKIIVGEFKINFSLVNQKRFDSQAFKTIHPDIYAEFSKTSSYHKLIVTKRIN